MDNKNQPTQTNQAPTIPPEPTPTPTPVSPIIASQSGDSKKLLIFFLIGIVVIVAVVAAIYFYLSRQQSTASAPAATVAQSNGQTTQTQPDAIEQELNSINPTSVDDSMSTVDQDLKSL